VVDTVGENIFGIGVMPAFAIDRHAEYAHVYGFGFSKLTD